MCAACFLWCSRGRTDCEHLDLVFQLVYIGCTCRVLLQSLFVLLTPAELMIGCTSSQCHSLHVASLHSLHFPPEATRLEALWPAWPFPLPAPSPHWPALLLISPPLLQPSVPKEEDEIPDNELQLKRYPGIFFFPPLSALKRVRFVCISAFITSCSCRTRSEKGSWRPG